jgi:hypothetical protein
MEAATAIEIMIVAAATGKMEEDVAELTATFLL